jgi:hypothetical protein
MSSLSGPNADRALDDLLYAIRATRRQMGRERWDWEEFESVLAMNMLLLGYEASDILRDLRATAEPLPSQKLRLRDRFTARGRL